MEVAESRSHHAVLGFGLGFGFGLGLGLGLDTVGFGYYGSRRVEEPPRGPGT